MDGLLRVMPAQLAARWLAFYELEHEEQEAGSMEADVRARAAR